LSTFAETFRDDQRLQAGIVPIRVLVVESDATSRKMICSVIEREAEVTAECVDGAHLASSIQRCNPDLVVLDVNTAITQSRSWDAYGTELSPEIIITAYDPATLVDFAGIAVDVLVKPFDVERLEAAVARARLRIAYRGRTFNTGGGSSETDRLTSHTRFLRRIAVETDEKIVIVKIEDIEWMQTLGKHVRLCVGNTFYLLRQSMRRLEAHLDPSCFLRVHRNAIVNLDHVVEFHLPPEGNMFVKLHNGVSLPLRRGNRALLRKVLKQIA
jgi:two-component system LytT family response regulator